MQEMGGAGTTIVATFTMHPLCSMQPGRVVTLVPKEEVRTICTNCEISTNFMGSKPQTLLAM